MQEMIFEAQDSLSKSWTYQEESWGGLVAAAAVQEASSSSCPGSIQFHDGSFSSCPGSKLPVSCWLLNYRKAAQKIKHNNLPLTLQFKGTKLFITH